MRSSPVWSTAVGVHRRDTACSSSKGRTSPRISPAAAAAARSDPRAGSKRCRNKRRAVRSYLPDYPDAEGSRSSSITRPGLRTICSSPPMQSGPHITAEIVTMVATTSRTRSPAYARTAPNSLAKWRVTRTGTCSAFSRRAESSSRRPTAELRQRRPLTRGQPGVRCREFDRMTDPTRKHSCRRSGSPCRAIMLFPRTCSTVMARRCPYWIVEAFNITPEVGARILGHSFDRTGSSSREVAWMVLRVVVPTGGWR